MQGQEKSIDIIHYKFILPASKLDHHVEIWKETRFFLIINVKEYITG